MTAVTASDVLNRAADLLGEFGWCQGTLGGKAEGEMCLLGAIFEASNDLGSGFFALRDLEVPLLVAGVPCGDGSVEGGKSAQAEWNDAPGRTKAEVVAALRAAAAVVGPVREQVPA